MSQRNCLILTQYRNDSAYNDFIGKFYHFPATARKNYLKQFEKLPIEFVYFEPQKDGEGVFFGFGKIEKLPFPDRREPNHYFVEISEYKPFSDPLSYKDEFGKIREAKHNKKYYNAQNAVRRIEPNFLDALCLDGGIQLTFRADSHLIQVLGEQLIGSERVGILELVKNAYDAGSRTCRVRIENAPSLDPLPASAYEFPQFEGPVVVVEDFGRGMNRSEIEEGWLRPASTLKTRVKERLRDERETAIEKGQLGTYNKFLEKLKKEYKGRIPLGEKGVGRFAANRLGRKLLITTKTVENDFELVLKINWDDFNNLTNVPVDLESIGVTLTRQSPSRDYGKQNSGTRLIIYGGKEGYELSKDEIIEIDRTLKQLNSPNPPPNSKVSPFRTKFECPQVDLGESKPIYEEFPPIFTLSGTVNDDGIFNYDFSFDPPESVPMPKELIKKGQLDLRQIETDRWRGDGETLRKPACGQFFIHINLWYRSSPWLTGPDKRIFTEYLDSYGGISVYRDGINVFPAEWGAEIDWLKLSKRHIKRGLKVSYYNMIGNLEIEQGRNITLIDKTSREGIISNTASADLVSLTRAVVLFLENSFIGKRREYSRLSGDVIREPRTLNTIAQQTSRIIDNIYKNYDLQNDPADLLAELGNQADRERRLVDLSSSLKSLEDSLNEMQEIRDLLTEQAGFGLGIAVAIHEITKTAANFYRGITQVIQSKNLDLPKLEELKEASGVLQNELKRLSPLRAIRTEKPQLFQISKSIEFSRGVFKLEFEKLGIQFKSDQTEDIDVHGRFGAMNQVFTNLFDNSCYWIKASARKHREIVVKISSKNRTVIVADSGPDIHESILPYLFEPGYSLRFPPSGIGLYVCKYYMKSMKGDIYLTPRNQRISRLSGAQFTLDFSRVRSGSTK